jgi:CRISPR/Cas system-associated exonuclease Cas4 (RecB family)
MLSVNEGTIPATKRQGSFIPFDVRKAFGLPTMDEQDALYAYTLFRLIQGAKEVYLFYNSETGSKGEEKSRYIRQIEQYLAKENPKIRIEYRNYSLPLRSQPAKAITIAKDNNYYAILREKAGEEKGISPSFISSYFGCSLQFLLNYVYRLRAKEEITEDLEAADFGTLFHDTMQALYDSDLGSMLSAADIKKKIEGIPEALDIALRKLHKGQATYIYSRNSLQMETIKLLVKRTLEHDMAYAPFRVISLEKEIKKKLVIGHPELPELWLQGKVDRVDEKDGLVRIIDYKTGSVKRYDFNFQNAEESLTSTNKEAFQTLFYTYLYGCRDTGAQMKPYILPLKDVNNGYRRVNEWDETYTLAALKPYEEKLKEILNIILDREKDILQVEDHSICSYCDYNTLCLR